MHYLNKQLDSVNFMTYLAKAVKLHGFNLESIQGIRHQLRFGVLEIRIYVIRKMSVGHGFASQ
jgi:hypothetical protein